MSPSVVAPNTTALANKDANVSMPSTASAGNNDVQKDLEYHRQVLKSKMEAQGYEPLPTHHYLLAHQQFTGKRDFSSSDAGWSLPRSSRSGNNYISPSDEIMSPCTAKLNALRNKQVGKYVTQFWPLCVFVAVNQTDGSCDIQG